MNQNHCFYCVGGRSMCMCTADCGARHTDPGTGGHICGQAPAEVRAEWLRSCGYTDEDIARLVK